MRILILDDHPMVLAGLAANLQQRQHSISSAREISQAVALLQRQPAPELLLLDFHLADGPVTPLFAYLSPFEKPLVAILSGMTDPEDILNTLELGANAFIHKSIEPDDLGPALESLHVYLAVNGNKACIWDIRQREWRASRDTFPPATVLTPKEREVFMYLRQGLLDKQIADELGLSIHTVRVHIRAIKRKRSNSRRAEQEL